jgi:hypothetical protein
MRESWLDLVIFGLNRNLTFLFLFVSLSFFFLFFQLVSKPILMEPMYVCDITVPTAAVSGVYETLNARRGQVEGQDDRPGTPLTKVGFNKHTLRASSH